MALLPKIGLFHKGDQSATSGLLLTHSPYIVLFSLYQAPVFKQGLLSPAHLFFQRAHLFTDLPLFVTRPLIFPGRSAECKLSITGSSLSVYILPPSSRESHRSGLIRVSAHKRLLFLPVIAPQKAAESTEKTWLQLSFTREGVPPSNVPLSEPSSLPAAAFLIHFPSCSPSASGRPATLMTLPRVCTICRPKTIFPVLSPSNPGLSPVGSRPICCLFLFAYQAAKCPHKFDHSPRPSTQKTEQC